MKITDAKIIRIESKDKLTGDPEDFQKGSRWELDVQFGIVGHLEPYVAHLQVRCLDYQEEVGEEMEDSYELLGLYLLNENKDQIKENKTQLNKVHDNLVTVYDNLLNASNIEFGRLYIALKTSLEIFGM